MTDMGIIHSMTGFGAGAAEDANRTGLGARVEIRSVNHRGMKLNIRSRPSLGPLEKKMRDLVQSRLKRGSVDVYITLMRPVAADNLPVREDVAKAAVAALRHLGHELELSGSLQISDLVHIPDLFDTGVEGLVSEEEWPVIQKAAETALVQVVEMRTQEGAAMARCLLELLAPIQDFATHARTAAPQVVERARARLTSRIEELRKEGLDAGDRQAVEREICLFSDRADIHEEMDRLDSHLQQFRDTLQKGGETGKRLEFVAQEFLREVNTTASKANDTEIVTWAVSAKLAVEKIKEQVANIE